MRGDKIKFPFSGVRNHLRQTLEEGCRKAMLECSIHVVHVSLFLSLISVVGGGGGGWRGHKGEGGEGALFLRICLWWSLCTLYLLAC